MWFIFGWGYRSIRDHGPVAYRQCDNCHNTSWFRLVTIRRWFTLFFIPIVPYRSAHMLLCSVCSRGPYLSGEALTQAKRMNQLALQYTSSAISADEYRRLLPNVSGAAQPGQPALPAPGEASVTSLPTVVPADPPRDVPPLQSGRSGRATIIRVGVGLAVLAAAIVLFAVTRSGSGTTAFTAGNCVSGSQTSTSISATSCSGTHDARIDSVLANQSETCPATDLKFVPDSSSLPALCLDYTDHNP